VGTALGVSALGVWLSYNYVWYQYDGTRPPHPDALAGRIFAQNTHGHTVYLTAAENARLTKLAALAIGLFACSGVIYYFILGERQRKPQPWDKKQW
jgi:hypothetical protein